MHLFVTPLRAIVRNNSTHRCSVFALIVLFIIIKRYGANDLRRDETRDHHINGTYVSITIYRVVGMSFVILFSGVLYIIISNMCVYCYYIAI